MENSTVSIDAATMTWLQELLDQQRRLLAESDLAVAQRSSTARNYDTSLGALISYLTWRNQPLPTRDLLEEWRDDMFSGAIRSKHQKLLAVNTINARLAAARKLLRQTARLIGDPALRLTLEDWAMVSDVKVQATDQHTPSLTLLDIQHLLDQPDTRSLKGLRDRALIAVLSGAGLRISEALALRWSDLEPGEGICVAGRSVLVRDWVYDVLVAYLQQTRLYADDPVFWSLKRISGGTYEIHQPLAVRSAQAILAGLKPAVTALDLRRSYATLCLACGMTRAALRHNLGLEPSASMLPDWDLDTL